MIPSFFHQIWIGDKPISNKLLDFQRSWRSLHHDWLFILWNESNIYNLKYFNSSLYHKCSNYVEKSDYLRVIILLEYGGIYLDMDMECLININSLRDNDFFIGNTDYEEPGSAVIGSIPNQRFLLLIYDQIIFNLNHHPGFHSINTIGVGLWRNIIDINNLDCREIIYPPLYFYPIHFSEYWDGMSINKNILISNGSYCVHHFSGSWLNAFSKFRKKFNPKSTFGIILTYFYFLFKKIKNL